MMIIEPNTVVLWGRRNLFRSNRFEGFLYWKILIALDWDTAEHQTGEDNSFLCSVGWESERLINKRTEISIYGYDQVAMMDGQKESAMNP